VTEGTWRITEHAGLEGLASLQVDWRALTDAMPACCVYHLWESHRAYARHLASSPDAMTYLALRDDDRVRAIFPLESRLDRSLGVPLRVWGLTWSDEWPLGDVIAPEDDARAAVLPQVLRHLRASGRRRPLLVLGPLPTDSVLWDALTGAEAGRTAIYPQAGWGIVDCSRPFDETFSALSKNFRGNLRKARNKLAKLEGVEFVSARGPEALASELEVFLDVEASGWKGAAGSGTAIRLNDAKVAFYRDLTASLAEDGRCWIDSLYADGRCIATELNFLAGGDFEMLKIGYDEEYARVAPGQMLFEYALRGCCDDPGIATLNLLSDTVWNRDWNARCVPMQMARVSVTGSGRPLVPALRFRFGAVRRIVRRMQGRA
jgi:hypothetical protein